MENFRMLIKILPLAKPPCSVPIVQVNKMRRYSDLIPPSQYDMPLPKRFQPFYVMKTYWETIPLFITCGASIALVFFIFIWDCRHKVDFVASARSRNNISRTMNLRTPEVHKFMVINQRYEPWPEMQDTLDKMKEAERRVRVRAETCNLP